MLNQKPNISTGDDFRYDINALRAIAIISVVAYHYGISGFSGGFAGVDIFFVISGFLISSHINRDLEQGRFSFAVFYVSRLRRIFPALAVMCITCSLWGWYYTLPKEYLVNTRHELWSLLFVYNYALSNEQGYFDGAASTKPLLHTWSLSVEGQFYLFLPLFLAVIWRFFRKHINIITALVFATSLAWCLYDSQMSPATAFYQTLTRGWEFMAGTLLALIPIKKNSAILSNIGSVIGLSVLIVSISWLNSSVLWPSYYTLLPVAGSVLLIVSGDALLTRWCFSSWLLQRLGDISYSLYLWHWPVWVFAKLYVNRWLERELSQLEMLELMSLAIILATLSWSFVEKPTRFKKGWWSSKRICQAAVITLSVFIALTIASAITKGFRNRLPDYAQRAFSKATKITPRIECFRNEASEKKATEQFCQFGAEKKQASLLLWGDSHANMYVTALSKAAKEAGLTGYIATQSYCYATLTNQPNLLTGLSGKMCTQFNNGVNKFVEDNPNIRTVIIAKMWGAGDSFDRTINLINHLVRQGKNIILIYPTPSSVIGVPERWIYQQLRAGHAVDTLTTSVTSQQGLFDLQHLAQQQLSAPFASGRIIAINPLKKLCNKTDCLLVDNGIIYFKDMSHLSEAGAMLFADDFALALKALN